MKMYSIENNLNAVVSKHRYFIVCFCIQLTCVSMPVLKCNCLCCAGYFKIDRR